MKRKKEMKKKRGKTKIVIGAICFCLLTAAGGVLFWQRQVADASDGLLEITAGEKEELVYAQIDGIVGNDLEVSLVKEENGLSGSAGENGFSGSTGENGFSERGDGSVSADFPEPSSGDLPGGFPGGSSEIKSAAGAAETGIKSLYTLTGETRSLEVPVGTPVITKLGVSTTFSRLSSGNIIAVLLEEGTDNILKIWIVS